MKQMQRKKLAAIITLISGIVLTLAITTTAATYITKTIKAQFGINITLNDQQFTPTDANGTEVQAMMVDGTTYLPVRALAEATGNTVQWDAATSTVKVYTSGNGAWTPVDKAFVNMMRAETWNNKLTYQHFKYTTSPTVLKEHSNQDYQTGFIYTGDSIGSLTRANIWIETERQYNTIQFQISVIHSSADAAPVTVLIQDSKTGTIYGEVEITADNQTVEADISGADEIEVTFAGEWDPATETRQITIGDMKLRG